MKYLCRRSDVVCVQETRRIETGSAYLPDSHQYFHNLFEEEEGDFTTGAGGILFVVRRTLLSRPARGASARTCQRIAPSATGWGGGGHCGRSS